MLKRTAALFTTVTMMLTLITLPSVAATTYIATNIPKSFPVVKQDSASTVVSFWHAMTGTNASLVDNLANWYNATTGKKNKIYVKTIFQGGYDEIAIKLHAVMQANNIKSLPDLVQLSSKGAFSVMESKNIVYMEDLMKADPSSKIKDKLNKNTAWACSYKGKQVGMPFSCSLIALHYNVNAFKAVGLDPESPPKTFSELAEYASKLLIKGKGKTPARYGIAHKLAAYGISTMIPRQRKGTAFEFDKEDGRLGVPTKFLAADEGTLKVSMTAWKNLCDTGAVYYSSSSVSYFRDGLTGMLLDTMTDYDAIEKYFLTMKDKTKAFEHKMARMPIINADDAIDMSMGGSAIYMFDRGDAAKQAATWDFVKFLASADVSAYWYVNSGYFPMSIEALNTKYVADSWAKEPNKKIMTTFLTESSKNYKFQTPFMPNLDSYDRTIQNAGILMGQGKKTVDQAVDMIKKSADKALADYWKGNK